MGGVKNHSGLRMSVETGPGPFGVCPKKEPCQWLGFPLLPWQQQHYQCCVRGLFLAMDSQEASDKREGEGSLTLLC